MIKDIHYTACGIKNIIPFIWFEVHSDNFVELINLILISFELYSDIFDHFDHVNFENLLYTFFCYIFCSILESNFYIFFYFKFVHQLYLNFLGCLYISYTPVVKLVKCYDD